ncbi:hypothetical protein N5C46_15000 [Rossellomorea vietnamensis]|uniref:Uncharacterized protein n=1 Tax=Rossellomorea vietnamensis TaxID=218284 RepID=A0ACD4C3J8_9BACI|nr:hypothetical protein [Rossellomorea vietnamensis]UXH42991.1 hypothetical protein N5C46_15000 [Rossellomorea vietnamensis]
MGNSIDLTTMEFAASLALCGYENMASQVLNNMHLINDEEKLTRYIEEVEISLKSKGYWEEERSSSLVSGLEDLLHLLVHSKKKVRLIKATQILFIHLLDEKTVLIQEIKNQIHSFAIHKIKDDVFQLLLKYYKNDLPDQSVEIQQTLLLSDQMYDELHNLDPKVIDNIINDKKIEVELKQFLQDFKNNNKEFDNLSFMEMDYINDNLHIHQVIFMLPSEKFVWHLDYERINDKEVYVIPTKIDTYFEKINQEILDYFFLGDSTHV